MCKRGTCGRPVSVRLSVRHTRVFYRNGLISSNFLSQVAHPSRFSKLSALPNFEGNPLRTGTKNTTSGENVRFLTEIAVFLGNGTR